MPVLTNLTCERLQSLDSLHAIEQSAANPASPPTPEDDDAATFARTRLHFTPDAQQTLVLNSTAKRGILNCCRQWGKSTVGAAKAVHRALTQPKSLILVSGPTERQSAEFVRKAADMLVLLKIKPRGDGDNPISLLLPNGSRIVGLPGTEATVRGFSGPSLILIDEASRVEQKMYKALRPMLAVNNGDLWLISTPFGRQGFFYESWEHGGPDWYRVSVPATECPRIHASFLDQERGELGPTWFAQEYLCEFADNGAQMFSRTLVENAFDDTISPLDVSDV
jgi:hypothetical protein